MHLRLESFSIGSTRILEIRELGSYRRVHELRLC